MFWRRRGAGRCAAGAGMIVALRLRAVLPRRERERARRPSRANSFPPAFTAKTRQFLRGGACSPATSESLPRHLGIAPPPLFCGLQWHCAQAHGVHRYHYQEQAYQRDKSAKNLAQRASPLYRHMGSSSGCEPMLRRACSMTSASCTSRLFRLSSYIIDMSSSAAIDSASMPSSFSR